MKGYRALELGGSALYERDLPPHQARSCWRSARRDRGRLARDQIYLWLHGCPLQGRVRGSLPRTPSGTSVAQNSSISLLRATQIRHDRDARLDRTAAAHANLVTMDGRQAAQRLHPGRGHYDVSEALKACISHSMTGSCGPRPGLCCPPDRRAGRLEMRKAPLRDLASQGASFGKNT